MKEMLKYQLLTYSPKKIIVKKVNGKKKEKTPNLESSNTLKAIIERFYK